MSQVLDWEIDNALAWDVGRAIRVDCESARREVAKVFGTGRVGSKIAATIDAAIDRLVAEGHLIREDQMLRQQS